jgi:site-specific recombinase XerD
MFAKANPPRFLQQKEVQKLFDSLTMDSAKDLRAYAMVHLAYALGLRPKEISLITLDDIAFAKGQVRLRDRKSLNPITLPLPEETIKAIAAYMVGARPKSTERTLFLNLHAPYAPVSPALVSANISRCMHKAGLRASAYWLRHTYAQNLLEAGSSIFEIKQMLGHDRIQTSQRYIHIHTKLMREVLFDETL